MHRYIHRNAEKIINGDLQMFPVTAILGPRQCGKSTLAKKLGEKIHNFLYLDLELPSDLRKIEQPELFFETNKNKTICLDEIQRRPDLFTTLRGIFDRERRPGRILILGSASGKLIKQSSETLAGRISFINLTPFTITDINFSSYAAFHQVLIKIAVNSFVLPADQTQIQSKDLFPFHSLRLIVFASQVDLAICPKINIDILPQFAADLTFVKDTI